MADDFVKELLEGWNLSSLIPIFEDEGIDEDAFKLLNVVEINNVIKKAGPRVKFLERFNEFLLSKSDVTVLALKNNDLSDNLSNSSSSTLSITSLEPAEFDSLIMPPPPPTQLSTYKVLYEATDLDEENIQPIIKKKTLFPGGLENYLASTVEGKIILSKKNNFDNDTRQKLSRIVVNFLLKESTNYKISTAEFIQASKEIENTFKGEANEIYYIPYTARTKITRKTLAKGKLWSRYINIKREYNKGSNTSSSYLDDSVVDDNSPDEDGENIIEKIRFLKASVHPWETVSKYWNETLNFRQKDNKNISLTEYFNLYPCLTMQDGYTLLLQDFDKLFSSDNNSNALFNVWPQIAEKIITLSNKRHIRLDLPRNLDKNLLAFLILPRLFPLTTIKKKKKQVWRPSKQEVGDSFIMEANSMADVHILIEERRNKLQKLQSTVQPYILVIGNLKEANSQLSYYACINEVKFSFINIVAAVDCIFKIIHATQACYSEESEMVWMFIQKSIYKISTNWDKQFPNVHTIISDIFGDLLEENSN